jgi:REP element-mobilizing transposase RayT
MPGLPSLRSERLFAGVRNAPALASRGRFRVLQFSVQADHLHLVVEANRPTGLARGLRGLAIQGAKAVNRAFGRHGP